MGRIITLPEDPYGENVEYETRRGIKKKVKLSSSTTYKMYQKSRITIEPGVTVLVGCNGAGKSTLLSTIRSQLKKKEIPCLFFDHLTESDGRANDEALYSGDFSYLAQSLSSSEGENIVLSLNRLSEKIVFFIKNGNMPKTSYNRIAEAFSNTVFKNEEKEKKQVSPINERWILLDACDSGLSIDNVLDIKKHLFQPLLAAENYDVYIIVAANEFEMVNGEKCISLPSCEKKKFRNYEKYKEEILNSRKMKEERYRNTEE